MVKRSMFPSRMVRAALASAALVLLASGATASARTHAGTASGQARRLTAPSGTGLPAAFVPHRLIVGYDPVPLSGVSPAARAASAATSDDAAVQTRLVRVPTGHSVTAAAARLRREPGIAYAEPDYLARAAGAWIPDDPGRYHQAEAWERMQWNLLPYIGVNAPEAWSNLRAVHRAGGKGVVVAVLDSGVAYRNWKQFHRSPDFGGTRFVSPYDFVAHDRYPLDRNGHGTFVASMLAEATNNGIALTGLAYGASIMPVRVLDASGLGDEHTIAEAIRYAVAHGAQIINLSLEFLPDQVSSAADIPDLVGAINYAHAHNVIVVAAAGNDQSDRIAYPARARNVISVGATTRDACLADYSNGGTGLDLVAPGGGSDAIMPGDPLCHPARSLPPIYQLTLSDPPHWGQFGYPTYYIGTSMSTPEVAGTAALVIASGVIGRHPTPAAVLARLEQTATPLGAGEPNSLYGWGLINAGAATAPGSASQSDALTR